MESMGEYGCIEISNSIAGILETGPDLPTTNWQDASASIAHK
jgi:hypothetical protein